MADADLQQLVPEASEQLRQILDRARGPVEAPNRSEIFGPERFAQHGRSLGETHRAALATARSGNFFPRFHDNMRVLREAHGYIGRQQSTGYDIGPAGEWLLDNFHLIEAQLAEIREGLPRRYFRDLPVLLDPPLAGLPRVYGVAWAFVAHTDGAFDESLLAHFLAAYQETRELNLGEMWALPTTLRVVLVENLRRLTERVATHKAARELANLCGDRIERYSIESLDRLLALLNQRGVGRVFLLQMAQLLQDQHGAGHLRYHEWLALALPDKVAAQSAQPIEQAADNLSVSNAIGSLRLIGNADWLDLVNHTSSTMRLLLTSPLFEAERDDTRNQTVHAIEQLARRSGQSERAVTQTLLGLMHPAPGQRGADVPAQPQSGEGATNEPTATPIASEAASHWLSGAGRPELLARLGIGEARRDRWAAGLSRIALPIYLGLIAASSAALVGWMLLHHSTMAGREPLGLTVLMALLMLFPASEAAIAVINRLISESARPSRLPRLAFVHGIPAEHRVMVVIPALLSSPSAAAELAHRLELHFLANPERHAQFALLTDGADADTETLPDDADLLRIAQEHISALNARHPAESGQAPRFIVLHRPRRYSATERRWIGWERKRGKLEELIMLLAEQPSPPARVDGGRTGVRSGAPFADLGTASRIEAGAQYVVTLDSDTQLPPGRLRELVGVAAHPDNQPRLDAAGRNVVAGYGILQPRVATPLPTPANVTLYHWLFAGQCGIDPYSAASSEVYQDVFGEGTYTGKGLMNVRAVHATLGGRLPQDSVLSHDLLEGSIARCAAVTDVMLIEDAPFHADVAASRVHRWIRGDWQLLPFVLHPARHGIGAVNRWKMIDNLRRSLVAPMSLALLLLALGTGALSPWAALALVFAAFSAGPLLGAVAGLAPSRDDIAVLHFYRQGLVDLGRSVCSGAWLVAQLLQLALMAGDSVLRAAYRITVSRRHLLEWTTAAAAQASVSTKLAVLARKHSVAPVVAALLFAALYFGGSPTPWLAGVLCAAWGLPAMWTWWVSRPRPPQRAASLPPHDEAFLHALARDTWRLFERAVGPADRHLPPDNLQTTPHTLLAHRTSPTNIGLYLTSAVCARAFGWIGTDELLERLEATLATLVTLARHRGHFLNWYDTQTGAALLPLYVSTVDSGNLSGHLLVVAQACLERAREPADDRASQRALMMSAKRLADLASAAPTLGPARATLAAGAPDATEAAAIPRTGSALHQVLAFADPLHVALAQGAALDPLLAEAQDELAALTPAEDAPGGPHDAWLACAADHLATLRSALRDRRSVRGADAVARLHDVAATCQRLAWEADYGFLYHRKRQLLHIGFRVAEQQLDASFYDLLASESRLTSLLAIAKGDVPVSHWAALGRPFYAVGAHAGLRSWSGSMFEYLMPSLVLDEPQGSVLHGACLAALREQIAYGDEHRVPWGISESAYAASDHTLAYQYAPQGVPRLALRRTPPDELVVAPYATALAVQIGPHVAVANFERLQRLGARHRLGFVEALDFTPARQSAANSFVPVATFMAHHQGMSIVAIANVLLGGAPRRWGMGDAHVEAVASLLHERAPREVSVLLGPPAGAPDDARQSRAPGMLRTVVPGASALEPTCLLSNGRYSVALRANGAGWSRWGRFGITRSRDDALRDAHGSFFHLRWDRQPQPVSLTQHPSPDAAAHCESHYHADRVSFESTWPELASRVTVWVSPEDDIEFRHIELRNSGDRPLELELMSSFEPTLADPRADEAHPAFSNLFLRAEWQPANRALVFERTPRLATEQGLFAAHFLANIDAEIVSVQVQPQRALWRGRNHDASQPTAQFTSTDTASDAGTAPQALDTGLDPVCAMSVRLRLGAHSNASMTFCTTASNDAVEMHALIDKYRHHGPVDRASLMSTTLTGIRLRELGITPENFAAIQTLTTALVMSLTRPRGELGDDATRPACDRQLLWRFGISGDRPIVLVTAGAPQGVGLLRSLVQALQVWSYGGVGCDLVVLNAEPNSYLMALQRELNGLRERFQAQSAAQPGPDPGALHVLRAEDVSQAEAATLRALARVHFNADGRPLAHHVQEWQDLHEAAFEERLAVSRGAVPMVSGVGLALRVPVGQFVPSSGEFRFEVSAFQRPLKPWVNVLANADFGAHLSEAGGGYTWALNSRLNQLTPWSNDPIADPPGEWFLLQDAKTREVWSVTPSAWGDRTSAYRIAHGQGYSTAGHRRGDLDVSASWCVDPATSVKQIRLRLVNRGHRTVRLRAVGMAEWIMGANRADRGSTSTAMFRQRLADATAPATTAGGMATGAYTGAAGTVSSHAAASPTRRERRVTALLCTQHERSAGFGDGTAFFAVAGDASDDLDWTCDRRECFDARGRLALPDHFGQRSGVGLDPCAALSLRLTVAAGETVEQVFLLGFGATPDAAKRLAATAAAVPAAERLDATRRSWDDLLGAAVVKTPDPLFDAMVNRWLLYQTVACRLWAKAGFYQAGGAYGFRDQLQDAMALAWSRPDMLRRQIVLNASRQFPEGDVQHWWHAPTGAGVRTHFSDDLLWLPLACRHYLDATGDDALLDDPVPFLEGDPIPAGAEDAYYVPKISATGASVYEHCARSIDHSLTAGAHGLPLMGTGDWNDGMNRVGHEGRGESVWLAWFLCAVVEGFAPLARARDDAARAERWEAAARGWKAALHAEAWDGLWFKRAFFDDGSALGSNANAECRIDLIAQAWSVLSGAAAPAFQRMALASMDRELVDADAGLIKLLTPALDRAQPSAGYIQAYPHGVRENGGQYSHAGVWALMAQARAGHADAAYRYFTYLSPAHRARHAVHGPAYAIEPYVMAGDVYTEAPYVGRGGWSWYTGSAAWLHRAAIESMFGVEMHAGTVRLRPCLPPHWDRAEISLRRGGRRLRVIFCFGTTDDAAALAARAGARLLAYGDALPWASVGNDTTVVCRVEAPSALEDAMPTAAAEPV